MQNVSWPWRCPSNILPQVLSFLKPLTLPTPILEGSCNKNQETIGDHFFSRKLTDTESCYSAFDRELLAAHAAIKHFCPFCEG